jgi:hypothetical protein
VRIDVGLKVDKLNSFLSTNKNIKKKTKYNIKSDVFC